MNQYLYNLLIHIGYHKTASSWLQQKLFTQESTAFEPLSKTAKGPSTLAEKFIYDVDHYLLSPFDYNEKAILDAFEFIIKNKKNINSKIPVISHERLSGNPHSGGFDSKKIAVMLKRIFPNAKILINIREQKSLILSNYFQYLSIGGTDSLEKYLNTKYDGKRPFFSPNHFDFLPLVKKYYNLFGKNNVLVLPYEKFKETPLSWMGELEKFLDIKLLDKIDDETFNVFINKKNDHFVRYKMRLLNLFKRRSSVNNYSPFANKYTRSTRELLINIINTAIPTELNDLLLKKQRLIISEWVGYRFVQSNQELGRLIRKDLSKYGYY